MEIDQLFNLPAHPLLVHVPVVLVPLALLVTVVALWPRLRRPAALTAAGLAVVGGIGVVLATGSGESLQESVPGSERVEHHVEQGEAAEAPAIVFGVVAVAAAVVNEVVRRRSEPAEVPARARTGRAGWLAAGAVAVSVVAGAVATVTVVQAGHSGADAVWHGTQGGGEAHQAAE
jgi:drug/metabolite transporter (DMT)-like permease